MWYIHEGQVQFLFKDGTPTVTGTGPQTFRPRANVFDAEHIKGAEALWSIRPNDNLEETEIDPIGYGFLKRISAAPDKNHFMISSFLDEEDNENKSVGFTIVLPPAVFEAQFPIWQKIVFDSRKIKFQIALDVIGFPVPHAESDAPTIDEWLAPNIMDRKPYFGSDITVTFFGPENHTDSV